jgi:hypothetical protein
MAVTFYKNSVRAGVIDNYFQPSYYVRRATVQRLALRSIWA